jgi:SPP1 family predicted phage head-tail adaptor
MRSGELRHRIKIQKHVASVGSWGHESAWQDIATVWASVIAKSGTEKFDTKTSGVNGSTTYEVRLRYRPEISSELRFIHAGRLLDLSSVVDPTGRKQELVCQCVEHSEAK